MERQRIGYERAVGIAQEFLGDLGVVVTSDPGHARVTDDSFIVAFHAAAEALKATTVVTVDRLTGATRFVTVNRGAPDPWPEAVPAGED